MRPANKPSIVLASGSSARRAMLEAAGVEFTVAPADLDEARFSADLVARRPGIGPADIAEALAREKATTVSRSHRGTLVVGSDQVLAVGERLLDKPGTRDGARATLVALSGRDHMLYSGVAIARDGDALWSRVACARLAMRKLSAAEIDAYLDIAGDGILGSVGAYHIEGVGIRLFERVEGDHFTIRGMPLLPLLGELRRWGAVP